MRLAATSARMSRSEVGDVTSKPEVATVAAAETVAAAAGCVRGGGNCE